MTATLARRHGRGIPRGSKLTEKRISKMHTKLNRCPPQPSPPAHPIRFTVTPLTVTVGARAIQ